MDIVDQIKSNNFDKTQIAEQIKNIKPSEVSDDTTKNIQLALLDNIKTKKLTKEGIRLLLDMEVAINRNSNASKRDDSYDDTSSTPYISISHIICANLHMGATNTSNKSDDYDILMPEDEDISVDTTSLVRNWDKINLQDERQFKNTCIAISRHFGDSNCAFGELDTTPEILNKITTDILPILKTKPTYAKYVQYIFDWSFWCLLPAAASALQYYYPIFEGDRYRNPAGFTPHSKLDALVYMIRIGHIWDIYDALISIDRNYYPNEDQIQMMKKLYDICNIIRGRQEYREVIDDDRETVRLAINGKWSTDAQGRKTCNIPPMEHVANRYKLYKRKVTPLKDIFKRNTSITSNLQQQNERNTSITSNLQQQNDIIPTIVPVIDTHKNNKDKIRNIIKNMHIDISDAVQSIYVQYNQSLQDGLAIFSQYIDNDAKRDQNLQITNVIAKHLEWGAGHYKKLLQAAKKNMCTKITSQKDALNLEESDQDIDKYIRESINKRFNAKISGKLSNRLKDNPKYDEIARKQALITEQQKDTLTQLEKYYDIWISEPITQTNENLNKLIQLINGTRHIVQAISEEEFDKYQNAIINKFSAATLKQQTTNNEAQNIINPQGSVVGDSVVASETNHPTNNLSESTNETDHNEQIQSTTTDAPGLSKTKKVFIIITVTTFAVLLTLFSWKEKEEHDTKTEENGTKVINDTTEQQGTTQDQSTIGGAIVA